MKQRRKRICIRIMLSAVLFLLLLPAMDCAAQEEALESDEILFLNSHPAVTVAIDSTWIPYVYLDSATGEIRGTVVEILNLAAQKIGLELEYVTLDSYSEALQKAQSGKTDLILGMPQNEVMAENNNLILTDPILEIQYSVITPDDNWSLNEDTIVSVCANLCAEDVLQQMISEDQILEYSNQEACVGAVKKGDSDLALLTADSADYYLEEPKYQTLQAVLIEELTGNVCIGVNDQCDPVLIRLLNKGIASLTEGEINQAIRGSLLEAGHNRASVFSYISRYRIHIGLAICALIAAICATASFFLKKLREEREKIEGLRKDLVDAEKSIQEKSVFLSRISHDIRTPMNAVIGMTGLALEKGTSAEAMEDYLKKIKSSSEYLINLVNDVLDLSKMDSGKIELHPETVRLKEYFRSVGALIRPLAMECRVEIVFEFCGIDKAYARLDKLRLQQILTNILSNAIKFTPPRGRVECIISNVSKENGIRRDRIVIRDNGIGMSEEFLQKLYLPFEQENTVMPRNQTGTGLGLTIVKNLVELMNGTISVTSKKGEGTEFAVEIPSEMVEESIVIEQEKKKAMTYDFTGKRILLCEDHPINAEIVMKLLEKKHMAVDHVENGKTALAQFSAVPERYYDAILMDIRMPIMDGLTTTKAIRALNRSDGKTVPIIAMTANALEEDIYQCKLAGMAAYVSKPIEPRVLYSTLYQFVFESAKQPEEPEQNEFNFMESL